MNHSLARAQARGAKAQAKALRPWFKKKRFVIPLALVALVLLGRLTPGGGDEAPTAGVPAANSASEEAAAPAPKKKASADKEKAEEKEPGEPNLPGIGDTVVAGEWEFKVTKFRCGIDKVGDDFLDKKAQGQFCFLNLSATNNGNDEETIDGDSQKLLDKDGKEYSSDSGASRYEDPESNLFLEGVNPGNTVKGLVVFDIPKRAKPTAAVLEGGFFGGDEAKISLR